MLAVGSFSTLIRYVTFRFTSFHYTTSFRSFHPLQHRTAKAIPSLHSTKPTQWLSGSWHTDKPNTMPIHIGIALAPAIHPKHLFHSIQLLHFLLSNSTIESGMLYFFLRSVYPKQPTKDSSVPIEILLIEISIEEIQKGFLFSNNEYRQRR